MLLRVSVLHGLAFMHLVGDKIINVLPINAQQRSYRNFCLEQAVQVCS